MKIIEVGGIQFNIGAIKDMTKKQFLETYRGQFKSGNIEEAWYKITGFKKSKKKPSSSK
jgi:hypothetical protein